MKRLISMSKLAVLMLLCLSVGGCDNVRVYGSVGYSSYGGYGGYGSRVAIGGRIY